MAFKAVLDVVANFLFSQSLPILETSSMLTAPQILLCTFITADLGIICSFYLEFQPLLFPLSSLAPTGYMPKSQPTGIAPRNFSTSVKLSPSPWLEVACTSSEVPRYSMYCISGSIFIVKDTDK